MGHPQGFAAEAALEDLCLLQLVPGVEVGQLLGSQGPWQHKVLRGVGSYGSRKYGALEGHGNQLQDSYLENPPEREAWQATVHRVSKSWIQLK